MQKALEAFLNSLNGLKLAWQDDASYRRSVIQVALCILLSCILAWYLGLSIPVWLVLIISQLPIVMVELINSAIEAVTDKASPERHPLAKKAKDIGSAAVLISRLLALLCWAGALAYHFR